MLSESMGCSKSQSTEKEDGKFYERGIMKLPGRWQKVIEQNGQYIID